MPIRAHLPTLAAILLAIAALFGGAARAQGVLLPPGEVPGAMASSGAAQPTLFQLFSPQQAVPQSSPKSQGATSQAAAPQAATSQAAAPPSSQVVVAPSAPAPSQTQASVPLPTPRPSSANTAPVQSAAVVKPVPVTPGPVAPAQADQDRAAGDTLQKVSDYWNRVQVLSGNFVQVDPDGSRKTGDFYMQKPGRVRFEYDAPVPLELISNGQSVAVRDRKLNTQDITPLSQTPLRFLLADQVNLAGDPHVVGAYQDNLYVTIVMEEKVPMMGTYRLMLLFDAKTYALKQWIVTDPQGYDTSVAISNLNYTSRPDPKLFVINFERMLQ